MSFYGESFSYNGRSCEEFGLMLYDIDGYAQGNSKFASLELQEERIVGSTKTLFYDAYYKSPLEFKLIFGAGEYEANQHEPIDRYEMQAIASWLTDQREYGWLVIDQPDMDGIRYHCIITDLEMIELFGQKWALQCKVHCDSPYGYQLPIRYAYTISGNGAIYVANTGSSNIPYLPVIKLTNYGTSIKIVNRSDNDRTFMLNNLPQSLGAITIDGERGLLTCDSGVNLYNYCSGFQWPRLVRGQNQIEITGSCTIEFDCEFPVNVGG